MGLGLRGDGLRGVEELVPRYDLHARPAERLAARALERVDRLPARVDDAAHTAFVEERVDGLGGLAGVVRQTAGLDVLEQQLDGLRRVLLVRADDARRPALDPARAVRPRDVFAVVGEDAAGVVADRAARLVERNVGQGHTAVADAAEHETARDRLALVRSDGDNAILTRLEPVAHDLDRLDALLAVDRDRGGEEAQVQRLRLARR